MYKCISIVIFLYEILNGFKAKRREVTRLALGLTHYQDNQCTLYYFQSINLYVTNPIDFQLISEKMLTWQEMKQIQKQSIFLIIYREQWGLECDIV